MNSVRDSAVRAARRSGVRVVESERRAANRSTVFVLELDRQPKVTCEVTDKAVEDAISADVILEQMFDNAREELRGQLLLELLRMLLVPEGRGVMRFMRRDVEHIESLSVKLMEVVIALRDRHDATPAMTPQHIRDLRMILDPQGGGLGWTDAQIVEKVREIVRRARELRSEMLSKVAEAVNAIQEAAVCINCECARCRSAVYAAHG